MTIRAVIMVTPREQRTYDFQFPPINQDGTPNLQATASYRRLYFDSLCHWSVTVETPIYWSNSFVLLFFLFLFLFYISLCLKLIQKTQKPFSSSLLSIPFFFLCACGVGLMMVLYQRQDHTKKWPHDSTSWVRHGNWHIIIHVMFQPYYYHKYHKLIKFLLLTQLVYKS